MDADKAQGRMLVEVLAVVGVNPETGQVVRIPIYTDAPPQLAYGDESNG